MSSRLFLRHSWEPLAIDAGFYEKFEVVDLCCMVQSLFLIDEIFFTAPVVVLFV